MPLLSFGALLCDFDGVLRHWPSDGMTAIDRTYGLPQGTLAAAAFAPERLDPAVTGKVTDEEWRASVADDLAEPCGSLPQARAMVASWTDLVGEVDRDVYNLLVSAREHVPVVLVSNATSRLESDLDALGVSDAFDAVVNTSRIGVAKPDAGVYTHAAAQAGVEMSRCLFVDDMAAHVEGARAVGMTGLLYTGIGVLRTALAARGGD